jgi:hypothetical protein
MDGEEELDLNRRGVLATPLFKSLAAFFQRPLLQRSNQSPQVGRKPNCLIYGHIHLFAELTQPKDESTHL